MPIHKSASGDDKVSIEHGAMMGSSSLVVLIGRSAGPILQPGFQRSNPVANELSYPYGIKIETVLYSHVQPFFGERIDEMASVKSDHSEI
ncbi:hypothetical protein RRG08_037404 [Elysia crispata]|uniref:Uncharacterized protein n=1 Tax=Elysia crispata TaxID=231223 RepID=A0AAE1AFN1_9GAST|nr:hypothetical protein RRG08_037404 [Elysia crispata]